SAPPPSSAFHFPRERGYNLADGGAARQPAHATNREESMPGLYFEDFSDDQLFRHPITRTITETDNVLFSTMTMNPAAPPLDHHYAATQTEVGKPLVYSLCTRGLRIGIDDHDTTHGTTIATRGMSDVVFPKPVFHADTIRVETRVLCKRCS